MRISSKPPVWLTYCLSIHGGESAADVLRSITRDAQAVRAVLQRRGRLTASAPFALGLRIGARALRSFAEPKQRRALADVLRDLNLTAVTINAFPYGRFHRTPVKREVYLPDWSSALRLDYTLSLAGLLSEILPEGVTGSLSTVPLGYGDMTAEARCLAVSNVAEATARLAALRRDTGRQVGLALEPEPDCVMENAARTVRLFEQHLFPAARSAIGGTARAADAAARRHLGVCLDTCHHAVLGESPATAWSRYDRAGLRVLKTQLSAALVVPAGPGVDRRLAAFNEGIYLHQTAAFRMGRCVERWPDLPVRARSGFARDADEWRVHCHVPLGWSGDDGLGTTRGKLTPAFFRRLAVGDCPHAEIETYTFQVLPAVCREKGITASIADEFEWTLDRWAAIS